MTAVTAGGAARARARTRIAAERSRRRSDASPAPGPQHALLVSLVALLCTVGLMMVLSASATPSIRAFGSPWHFFVRQVIWLCVGTAAFAVAWRLGPARLRRLARPAVFAAGAGLLAVLVPGVGIKVAGAARWVGTSTMEIQPSELAKLALIAFAADVLDRRAGATDWKHRMVPVLAVLGVFALLVMAEPDMGTTMVLTSIGLAMVFTAGMPARQMAGLLGGGAVLMGLLALAAPYRMARLTSFRNPLADAGGAGYQAVQGAVALAHGRLIGDGLGSSILSSGYLPNASTDFIFAVIGEEAGLVGTLGVTALFAVLAVVGTRVACRSADPHGALVAAGVTAWITSQALINIGAVVQLLPVTGVPLPFVSFGGSSLVITLFAMGLLAHVARRP